MAKYILIPLDFLKAIGEKPPYYRIYWVKWLSDYTQDLLKTDFIAHFQTDMSKVGKDLSLESIKEAYEFGMEFFKDGFLFEEEKKRKKKMYPDSVYEVSEKVICHLNSRCNTTYNPKSKTILELISARIKDGYSISDFMVVIDKKSVQWLGTSQQAYLRPITLFAPQKFETYLNENNNVRQSNSAISKLFNATRKAKDYLS